MSWTSRAVELMNLGLSQSEALAFVARERAAADAGEPAPELPPKVLEKYGQFSLLRAQNDKEAVA